VADATALTGVRRTQHASTGIAVIDATRDGIALALMPAYPVKEVDDLDGTYVLLNSVPAESPWTVELQTP